MNEIWLMRGSLRKLEVTIKERCKRTSKLGIVTKDSHGKAKVHMNKSLLHRIWYNTSPESLIVSCVMYKTL